MISSGPPPKTSPTHTHMHTHTPPQSDWDSFFWQTLSVCISSPLLVLHVLSVSLSLELKGLTRLSHPTESAFQCISTVLNCEPAGIMCWFFFVPTLYQKTTAERHRVVTAPLQRPSSSPPLPSLPAERSMLIEKRDGGSRRVFLPFHFFSSDTARGHRRRDGGSFSLPPRSTIGLPATSPVIYDAVKMYTVFSVASTKGHRVVLDASISRCAALLSHLKRETTNLRQSVSIYLPCTGYDVKMLIPHFLIFPLIPSMLW